jgi:glycosyltransferase involved in cell wall biosynthesis
LNITIVSHAYPTKHDPSKGVFIQKEAQLISEFAQVEVLIPSVVASPLNPQFYRNIALQEETFPVQPFKYLSIPRRLFPSFTQNSLFRNLSNELQNSSTNVVHLHALFPAGITAAKLKKAGFNTIISIHGGDWYTNITKKKMKALIHESLLDANFVITVGKQLRNDIKKTFPEIANKLIHLPHGIDTNLFNPAESKSFVRRQLNWNENKIHILFVGNLFKVKGIDLLIKAFYRLKTEKQTHLHLVTPRWQKDAKTAVEKLIEKFKLHKQVSFYSAMPHNELAKYYQAADLFVSSSLKEGFGLAIAEAASCGTPVVATRSGGPEEILSEKIGVLTEVNDVMGLKTSIENILQSLENFSPEIMNEYINSNFGLEQKKKTLISIYSKI